MRQDPQNLERDIKMTLGDERDGSLGTGTCHQT